MTTFIWRTSDGTSRSGAVTLCAPSSTICTRPLAAGAGQQCEVEEAEDAAEEGMRSEKRKLGA
jgi:hypothetical protein